MSDFLTLVDDVYSLNSHDRDEWRAISPIFRSMENEDGEIEDGSLTEFGELLRLATVEANEQGMNQDDAISVAERVRQMGWFDRVSVGRPWSGSRFAKYEGATTVRNDRDYRVYCFTRITTGEECVLTLLSHLHFVTYRAQRFLSQDRDARRGDNLIIVPEFQFPENITS